MINTELGVTSRRFRNIAIVLGFAAAGYAAEEVRSTAPDTPASVAITSTANPEIQDLKRQLAEQQRQIDELRRLLLEQRERTESARGMAAAAEPETSFGGKRNGLGDATGAVLLPAAAAAPPPLAYPVPTPQKTAEFDRPSPLQIHIGDATITPVGFMDLTNTFRSTNAGTSLQTNFGSIPYNNTIQGRLTEDKFSAANSRIGFRVDATFRGVHLLGYYEGDFVGGVAGNNTQVSSNSLLYRIRLYWLVARKGPFEMLAGQSWSMLTPNRKQISALPVDLFYSQVVDVNYMNGLTWGRIPGIRFLYHPSEKVTMGVSLENATQYFGGSGGGGTPTLPAALATYTSEVDANVINGIATPNVHPDIIAKLAFDPSPRLHFEIAGVERTVRLFNPTTQQYFTKAGGGGSINANLELFKNFRLVTNNYWSDGGGRYLFGVAPDFIVRADGSPSLIHSGSTVSGFEAQVKKTQLYVYYGGIYIGRNTALDANRTSLIGYGFRGSSNAHNRTTQEGTVGFTQTLWRDARYGAAQVMLQYAYLFRNPWFVGAGAPENAHENVVWFNLRYVLPGSAPTIKY